MRAVSPRGVPSSGRRAGATGGLGLVVALGVVGALALVWWRRAGSVDAAEIGQEPEAPLDGGAWRTEQIVRQPIASCLNVRPIAPEQLVQIADHLLLGRQRSLDLDRLDHGRGEALRKAGVAIEPGNAGRLAEVIDGALERIHALLPVS